jgi:hypothetical protein
MKAEIKYVCKSFLGTDIQSGVYDVPDEAKVCDLIRIGAEESGAELPADLYDHVIFLINGKPGVAEDRIANGDTVHMLQRIFGG